MDYAIRKRSSGCKELVYARALANDPYFHFFKSANFICPECREPVRLVNGDERTYFRHLPNNPKTQDCPNHYSDNRYAAMYQRQQEERKSGQRSKNIYILKGGETFGLFLGFSPLEEKIVASARNENLIVQIINPNNAELKENRLLMSQVVAGESTYIQLKWICDYYSLKYSECSVNQGIIKSWREYQAGLPEEGALFRYSSNTYARGISENAEITTDKYYYLATASKIPDHTEDFLEYEPLGTLEGKSFGYESEWRIYRIQFIKVTENAQEFANNLRVKLIEWHPPLIPLWPPHVQHGNRQLYSRPTHILSLAQKADRFSYYQQTKRQSRKPIPKIRINTGWLLDLSIKDSTDITSNGGCKVHLMCGCSDEISHYKPPEILLECDSKPLENGDSFLLKDRITLSFNSDSKCNIYHHSEEQLKSVYWNEQTIHAFLNLSDGDKICVRHGMDVTYQVSVPKRIRTIMRDSIKCDDMMYQKLALGGDMFISTPVKVKYIRNHLGNCPKRDEYLRKAIISRKISRRAYYHLISELNQETRK
ncbi:competence protein CoiA family protein [Methanoculleus sp. 7T]|uniref:hypothetical protein n=1 Tax=Methanoculleus sp. 7T TaxID=2937282 RepID=UPI0020C10187|nr:hypothetical protein [Methanoculleus sp. 7T]MCK8519269.1 hypothetical protein [Methanoculleus sp. 7T]